MNFYKGEGFGFKGIKDRWSSIIDELKKQNESMEEYADEKCKEMINLFVDIDKNSMEEIKIMFDNLGLQFIAEDQRLKSTIKYYVKYKSEILCYFISRFEVISEKGKYICRTRVTDIIETPYFTENKEMFQKLKGKRLKDLEG